MGFFNLEIGTKDFKQKKKSAAGHKNYLGLIIDRGVIQHCLGFGHQRELISTWINRPLPI